MDKQLLALEDRRLEIKRNIGSLLGFIVIFLILGTGIILTRENFYTEISALLLILFAVGMTGYEFIIATPFKLLKNDLKKTLLHHFITEFHPAVSYNYFPEVKWVKDLCKYVVRLDRTIEEDGVQIVYNETTLRLSDLKTFESMQSVDSEPLFQGWFLHVQSKGKNFPRTEIKSRKRVLPDFKEAYWKWQEFKKIEDSFLSYLTVDQNQFEKQIEKFIPFLDHLVEKIDALRIIFYGHEIFMFLETPRNFLDSPDLTFTDSVLDDAFIQSLAKQINTFLFIAETLTNDYDKSEVEERLELKILSMLPSDVIL